MNDLTTTAKAVIKVKEELDGLIVRAETEAEAEIKSSQNPGKLYVVPETAEEA